MVFVMLRSFLLPLTILNALALATLIYYFVLFFFFISFLILGPFYCFHIYLVVLPFGKGRDKEQSNSEEGL